MFSPLLAIPILLSVVSPSAGHRIATSTPTGIVGEVRTSRDEHKATVEAKISLVRRERIRAFWARMVTRIEAAIGRLETLIDRIEARIKKIKEGDSSLNTIQPEKDIADAKALLSQTKTDLETAKTDFEEMLTSEEPKAAFAKVIDKVHEIKANLVEAHKLLVHAIGDIKGLRVGSDNEKETETPTP